MRSRAMVMVGLAVCILAAAKPAQAQGEAQPVAERSERAEQRNADRPRARVPGPGRASQEEIDDVLEFMREHSPNRVRAMETLQEGNAAKRGVIAFVTARYRALQAVKEEDPKLYDIKVRQVEIEDELYGLLTQARGDREKARDQIRAVTRRLVEENLAEREQRLNRLRESLQREEQKLDADRAQMETITDTRTNMLIQDGMSALRREMLRHGVREEGRREGRAMGAATRPVEQSE